MSFPTIWQMSTLLLQARPGDVPGPQTRKPSTGTRMLPDRAPSTTSAAAWPSKARGPTIRRARSKSRKSHRHRLAAGRILPGSRRERHFSDACGQLSCYRQGRAGHSGRPAGAQRIRLADHAGEPAEALGNDRRRRDPPGQRRATAGDRQTRLDGRSGEGRREEAPCGGRHPAGPARRSRRGHRPPGRCRAWSPPRRWWK